MSDLISIKGSSDDTGTMDGTDVLKLYSEWFEAAVNYVEVDKGLAAKVWIEEMVGAANVFYLEESLDEGSSWMVVKPVKLASSGHLELDKRKPIIITGLKSPNIWFRVRPDDTTVTTYLNAIIEFEQAR